MKRTMRTAARTAGVPIAATAALLIGASAGPAAADVDLHGFVEGAWGVRVTDDPVFDGVQVIVAAAAAVVTAPFGVPTVIVIVAPDINIVDPVKFLLVVVKSVRFRNTVPSGSVPPPDAGRIVMRSPPPLFWRRTVTLVASPVHPARISSGSICSV